MQKVIHDGLTC